MGLKGFERRLEQLVEGAFARAFRTSLRPIELGRRITRVMDEERTVGVKGQPVAPNQFTITLGQADMDQFAEIADSLARQLEEAVREHARDEGYHFMGPVEVELSVDDVLRTGAFDVVGRMAGGPDGGVGALVLASGDRVQLGPEPVVIGRLPDCDVIVSDPNVSRRHAEVRTQGDEHVVVDLGSTNGTRVNGVVVRERRLVDGDVIRCGSTEIHYQAS